MEERKPVGSTYEDFKWKYIILKSDGTSETVTIEGPKDRFAGVVLSYARHWCGPEAKVDHRARLIIAPKATVPGTALTEETLKAAIGHLKTGAVEFVLNANTSIVIRLIPSLNPNKQTYKILYDAVKVGPDYACTKAQLVKGEKLLNAVSGLYYIDMRYSL